MDRCKKCNNEINVAPVFVCPTCGYTSCEPCAISTKHICPMCYSSLQYKI